MFVGLVSQPTSVWCLVLEPVESPVARPPFSTLLSLLIASAVALALWFSFSESALVLQLRPSLPWSRVLL